MSKKNCLITSAVLFVLSAISGGLFLHNASMIGQQSIQAFGVGEAPNIGYWDTLVTLVTGLLGGTTGIGSIVAIILAFVKQQAPAIIEKYQPGTSDNVKAASVDITQIGLIQIALKAVKDEPTRKSLNDAGRSAFDDLKNRTFPEVVTQ